jgi:HSP20 family protein
MPRDLQPFGEDPFFSHFGKGFLSGFFSDPFFRSADFPRMDIEETKKDIIITLDLPGVDPKNVDIELQENSLVISGKSEAEEEVKKKHYYHKERRYGSFQRQIPLPCPVNEKDIKAHAKDGLLRITLLKRDGDIERPKKIPIET